MDKVKFHNEFIVDFGIEHDDFDYGGFGTFLFLPLYYHLVATSISYLLVHVCH